MIFAVAQTGAVVPPSAWSAGGAARPAGCAASQCCTGVNGAGEAPDGGGLCPLVFTVQSSGAGLGNVIVTAINALTVAGSFDVSATLTDDPSDGVDAVQAFVDYVGANANGPSPCASGLTAVDTGGDGHPDTFLAASLQSPLCFDVVPKMNTSVTPLSTPQVFKATLTVLGDGVATLGTRNVYFVVLP
jgi:hypothetical protein